MDHHDIPYCLALFGVGVAGVTACVFDLSFLRSVCLVMGFAALGASCGMAFVIMICARAEKIVEQTQPERENGASRIFIDNETENPEWN